MLDLPPPHPADPIVVNASRVPEPATSVPASVSVVDSLTIERLGAPLVSDFLRLLPSAAVAVSGPAGSLTEVRIRGAEANHTLLFIDGIRANDPAAGNAPRFELLNADLASRIEMVRGPQSALWGSEAIGGVIAVGGASNQRTGATFLAEGGSFATGRVAASGNVHDDRVDAAFAVADQRSRGTDAFDGTGDRDGYRNDSVRGRVAWRLAPHLEAGASGFATAGRSDFDGFSPVTFLHADTLDNSRNGLAAGRLWFRAGDETGLGGVVSASWLASSNVNRLENVELNRTRGGRRTLSAEVHDQVGVGPTIHHLVVAVEQEDEQFHARDTVYGGASDQDRSRRHRSVTAEWRADWSFISSDIAVRRDRFQDVKNSTTLRASLLARLGGGLTAAASYGEGIAQPTFYDLYGFFPGSFVGNPALTPERSRGFEAALKWTQRHWSASLAAYRQRLRDEIVDVFDPATFVSTTANAGGVSRRQGAETEVAWSPSAALRLHVEASYLDATEPGTAPGLQLRETRRPRWSGAANADGVAGRWTYGVSLAYSGERDDVDFDQFPAQRVRLDPYWLVGGRLAYRLSRSSEVFVRVANALDRSYRDVVGYRPSGRSMSGGLRLAFGG